MQINSVGYQPNFGINAKMGKAFIIENGRVVGKKSFITADVEKAMAKNVDEIKELNLPSCVLNRCNVYLQGIDGRIYGIDNPDLKFDTVLDKMIDCKDFDLYTPAEAAQLKTAVANLEKASFYNVGAANDGPNHSF